MTPEMSAHRQKELIAFCIGEQEFCVDIMDVREIRGWAPSTPMPHAPRYVKGVMNLRGLVLPVVDLASRLGLGEAEPTQRHAIIVVQVRDETVGLLVDSVSDILTIDPSSIQPPPPAVGYHDAQSFVLGLLAMEGRMVTLVSAGEILPKDLSTLTAEAA